jgi:hypothetical protein
VGGETPSYAEVVRSAGSSSIKKIGSLDQSVVARGVDHFPLEVFEIEVVRSAVNCFDLEKQPLGPLDKNHPEEDRLGDRGRSARGSIGSALCVAEDDDVKGFQILRLWKSQLVQIKKEVVRALGCVVEGLKAFGLGQKLGQSWVRSPNIVRKVFVCRLGLGLAGWCSSPMTRGLFLRT